jgi:hypothetical protein
MVRPIPGLLILLNVTCAQVASEVSLYDGDDDVLVIEI